MRDRTTTRARRASRRGFSLLEMLIALTISATLLTASLSALDASYRGYKVTTESASTHVVSRIVIHRLLTMVRTGQEFGPYPEDVLDFDQNPMTSDFMEFVTQDAIDQGLEEVTRIETRTVDGEDDRLELWLMRFDTSEDPPVLLDERPLLRDVAAALFILEYEPGPRLVRATIDLTIRPDDYREVQIGLPIEAPTIRLVASASPRGED